MTTKAKPAREPAFVRPEVRLADYWRKRVGGVYDDFDAILGRPKPAGYTQRHREAEYDVVVPLPGQKSSAEGMTVKDLRHTICCLVAGGFPLSFGEYHVAIAVGVLLAADVPYEAFFRTRWHETATHRGYGPSRHCSRCRLECKKKKESGS
jgi:hypothetical protein